MVQEGFLHLEGDRTSEAGRRALEQAVEEGDDPRASYMLALCHERRWQTSDESGDLESALREYRRALEREPDFPEAAENLIGLLLRARRKAEARSEAVTQLERIPRAGLVHLNLAGLLKAEGATSEAREHAALGYQFVALRALSQNERELARSPARRALALGVKDARLGR